MCQKNNENAIDMIVVKEYLSKHEVFRNISPNHKIYVQVSFRDAQCVTKLKELLKWMHRQMIG